MSQERGDAAAIMIGAVVLGFSIRLLTGYILGQYDSHRDLDFLWFDSSAFDRFKSQVALKD